MRHHDPEISMGSRRRQRYICKGFSGAAVAEENGMTRGRQEELSTSEGGDEKY
jgi:hypothetical protein